ncbi:hypothetical protein AMS68_006851 [Peltaster fructicola]|uniref:Adenylyl cyclase-associated protein n=1 Tax=Peltaster fructicola TaxID=286661 RepID=A0A6H0Y2U7_9PEZI|nr:hypothetical protein AMS68_006851 [Peltaster fructicola]
MASPKSPVMKWPSKEEKPLVNLILRLEAATSRLEDIASSAEGGTAHLVVPPSTIPKASASAPELPGLPQNGAPPAPKEAKQELPASIEAMDELIDTDVKSFVEASSIDPLVQEQARAVAQAFAAQRVFLVTSTKAKKPDMSSMAFGELIQDLQQAMGTVGDIRDSNRGSKVKEHLAMVGEGVAALQWLVMEGKPADYIGDVIGGAQMYGNRVLKTYKETEPAHVKFVQSYYKLLRSLQDYIKKHYPSGLTWNNNGIEAATAMKEAKDGSSQSSNAPPPPPPPPLPNFDDLPPPPPGPAPAAKSSPGDMGAVFDQLNRGSDVTKGLKKVDKSQMTHKNPALRASAETNSRSRSRGPETKPKPASMRQNSTASTPTKKEGRKELDGNKWYIENFDAPSSPIEIEVSLTQSILISRCNKTTIVLKGKANAISIDNSPRCQVLVENLVSSVDVIKSPNFAVQVLGSLPTIMLDQVDGASIYLSKESLNTEIFTSKCSSVNIVLPPATEDGDSTEAPLPEQLRSVIKNGKVVSEIVEHAG